MDDEVAAGQRTINRLQQARIWVGLGLLVYVIGVIIVLNLVRLPATLPQWAIVFFLPVIGGILGIPILRSSIAHYRGVVARAQLAATLRGLDEVEREQKNHRRS